MSCPFPPPISFPFSFFQREEYVLTSGFLFDRPPLGPVPLRIVRQSPPFPPLPVFFDSSFSEWFPADDLDYGWLRPFH